jgi:hypothetical protein
MEIVQDINGSWSVYRDEHPIHTRFRTYAEAKHWVDDHDGDLKDFDHGQNLATLRSPNRSY